MTATRKTACFPKNSRMAFRPCKLVKQGSKRGAAAVGEDGIKWHQGSENNSEKKNPQRATL